MEMCFCDVSRSDFSLRILRSVSGDSPSTVSYFSRRIATSHRAVHRQRHPGGAASSAVFHQGGIRVHERQAMGLGAAASEPIADGQLFVSTAIRVAERQQHHGDDGLLAGGMSRGSAFEALQSAVSGGRRFVVAVVSICLARTVHPSDAVWDDGYSGRACSVPGRFAFKIFAGDGAFQAS